MWRGIKYRMIHYLDSILDDSCWCRWVGWAEGVNSLWEAFDTEECKKSYRENGSCWCGKFSDQEDDS